MGAVAAGTFEVELTPAPPELEGRVGRLEIAKRFHGDLEGTGAGVMLSGGDPQAGSAGYVAVEVVRARLGGRTGSFVLQQFGTMHGGTQSLQYEIVPGSGDGELRGITGTVQLTIDVDGAHHYELAYEI